MAWIRSQNKKILMEIRQVEISKYNNIIIGFNNHFETLGSYSTEEKALKVLDMIQEAINGKKKTYYSSSGVGKQLVKNEYYDNTSNMVYQMPNDEEV